MSLPDWRRVGGYTLFGTEYRTALGATYTSHCWARSKQHRDELFDARGLGETPNGFINPHEPRASWLMRRLIDDRTKLRPDVSQVAHALVHLGHMVAAAHPQRALMLLADDGWMHEAMHRIAWVDGPPSWRPYVAAVIAAEHSVPGYLHPTQSRADTIGAGTRLRADR